MQLAPSALHATAETIAQLLGPWESTDPDHEGIVRLLGPLDRHIGMRLLHGGNTIQLWATGGIQPTPHDPEADPFAPHPLLHGHRWHTTAHIASLTEDQDPAVELYTAITSNLLPVFDAKPHHVGHRPWEAEPEAADDIEPADVDATVQAALAAGVDLDADTETEADPDDEPAQAPDRSQKLAQASWRTGARRYAEAQGATPENARAFGHWYIEQGNESPKTAPLEQLYAQWRDDVPDAPRDDQAPDAAPQPEPEPEPAAKAARTRTRRTKAETTPPSDEPKPRPARKRTTKPKPATT